MDTPRPDNPNSSPQRPVMDPLFVKPFTPVAKPSATKKWLVPSILWFFKALVSRPLAMARPAQEGQRRRNPMAELARAAFCQLLFLPLALGGTALLLVYFGTHPPVPSINADPNSVGVYFEQVNFTSTDGTSLTGWMAPALDAKRVIDQKDLVLRSSQPAVVLVHDFGQSPQQMLPLVSPLHEEGMNVMVVGLRGLGAGLPRGQTFGANESGDVKAAIDWLRKQPRVDDDRIAIVGFGTGATAALLEATRDAQVKALVLAEPVQTVDDMIAIHVGPREPRFRWLQPVCKWIYELYYHVEADDVNYARLAPVVASRPTLMLPGGSAQADYLTDKKRQRQIREFLRAQLHTMDDNAPTAAAQ